MEENKKKIEPLIVNDGETGAQYVLDFNRDTIKYAERMQFELENVLKYPQTSGAALFFYAFRKNHKFMPREKTDKMLEDMHGLPQAGWERLIQLFQQAQLSNFIQDEDDEETKKNSRFQIQL